MNQSHQRFYGIALAVFTLQRTAGATDDFPPRLEQVWGLSPSKLTTAVGGKSGCLLCHTDEVDTKPKTVGTPVGEWIKSQGVQPMDEGALQKALTKNYNSKQDS